MRSHVGCSGGIARLVAIVLAATVFTPQTGLGAL